MNTKLFVIPQVKGYEEDIQAAASILRSGGLVGIPTETVYGLGADALNEDAVRRIYEAKGRPSTNPLIIHVPSADWLDTYCADVPQLAYDVAEAFWPGPLTLILKAKPIIPKRTTGGLDTVAVRCPAHPVASAIIAAAGVPIAAPSANTSGRPSCTSASHVIEDMDGRIEGIVDGGDSEVGVESTILDLTSNPPCLLRPGGMPLEELIEVVGEVDIDSAVTSEIKPGVQPRAPGMAFRHYAPKAPVTVVTGSADQTAAYILKNVGKTSGVICFDEYAELFPHQTVECLGSAFNKAAQARRVFGVLRAFDSTDVTEIYAQCPDRSGLGFAVLNRLQKAAGFHIVEVAK
ncbi:MAG: threonylcarbamoyl-AMP synthase [Oscillospiraceae bacterium]|nr:threonylcarbamoyl-AMP synthase [Oscillospiraceae bacterium]